MNRNMDLHSGLTPKEERDFVLSEAQRLIRDGGWTQGCAAQDEHGCSVAYDSPAAKAFCISGAIRRAVRDNDVALLAESWAQQAVARVVGRSDIPIWNDCKCYNTAEALAALEAAKGKSL